MLFKDCYVTSAVCHSFRWHNVARFLV